MKFKDLQVGDQYILNHHRDDRDHEVLVYIKTRMENNGTTHGVAVWGNGSEEYVPPNTKVMRLFLPHL
jgi:hypothetical protein